MKDSLLDEAMRAAGMMPASDPGITIPQFTWRELRALADAVSQYIENSEDLDDDELAKFPIEAAESARDKLDDYVEALRDINEAYRNPG